MKNKIIILIILIIVIIMLIVNTKSNNTKEVFHENTENIKIENYIEISEDNTLKNKSEELKKNKEIENLEISNIRISAKEKETTILMDIKNKSKQIKGNKEVTLIMNDENKKEIGKIGLNISELKSNEAMTIEIKTEINFINTYDFVIIDKNISDFEQN